MDQQLIMSDFCQTLNRNPGCIEIAEAKKGGSGFNLARYYSSFTENDYSRVISQPKNYVWLNGIDQNPEALNKENKRQAKDGDVKSRNVLVFDIDFKEADPSFSNNENNFKEAYAKDVFEKHKDSLLTTIPGLWMVVFSGNGIHLYVRLKHPMVIVNPKIYSQTYEKIAKHIQTKGVKDKYTLDLSCKNPARIMRVPLSTNYKDSQKPIKTKVIYHNPDGFSDEFIGSIPDQKDEGVPNKKDKSQIYLALKQSFKNIKLFDSNDNHKENLKKHLTFPMILDKFYTKGSTISYEGNGEIKCSSPFKEDKTPSCYLNEEKKVFKCHSSNNEGDIFDFLGLIANEQEFPKILKIAEELTGINKPKDNNVTPLKKLEQKSPIREISKKKEPSFGEYVEFFNSHLPNAAQCILSGQCMTFIDRRWIPVASKQDVLESYAIETEYFKKTHIKPHLARYSCEGKERRLLIDIPPWDGVDRLKTMSSHIKFKNVSNEVGEYFLKYWGVMLFRRLYDPKIQNRILILTGGQGIGKDVLIDSLVGGLGQFKCNISMDSKEKENDAVLADHLVVNISEFDRTKNMSVSYLKDMVTSSQKTFRRPWGRVPEQYDLRCSFIASCNITDILRDHTGNRRFVILDIESIDWNYPQNESLQVLAQWKHLSNEGFEVNQAAEAAMKAYILSQTPDDPEQAVLEYCVEYILSHKEQTVEDMKEKLFEVQKLFGIKNINQIYKILKANGCWKKKNTGSVYFKPRNDN